VVVAWDYKMSSLPVRFLFSEAKEALVDQQPLNPALSCNADAELRFSKATRQAKLDPAACCSFSGSARAFQFGECRRGGQGIVRDPGALETYRGGQERASWS